VVGFSQGVLFCEGIGFLGLSHLQTELIVHDCSISIEGEYSIGILREVFHTLSNATIWTVVNHAGINEVSTTSGHDDVVNCTVLIIELSLPKTT
jgi:hypothetical protein